MRIVKAWINQPSKLQPFHKYHGKIGAAVIEKGKNKATFVAHDNKKTCNIETFEIPILCLSFLS